MTDEELVEAVRLKDDRAAYSVLVKRYQSRIRSSLMQLTGGDRTLADDLAQDTFIKAFLAIGQFRGSSSFGTWLYRIAYHRFISSRRKEQNISYGPLPPEAVDEELYAEYYSPTTEDLRRAISCLSVEQRSAIHFAYERGLTHQEIANIMDSPIGTIKSHITRGKRRLRELMTSSTEITCDN